MASQGMHRRNVTFLDEADQITHWTGSPATEGGALRGINMSPPAGPPVWDYDTEDGSDREQYKFNIETKILGSTEAEQLAFIARYAQGKTFTAPTISGLPGGLDWVVESALVSHNADGDGPSTLRLVLAEMYVTGTEDGISPEQSGTDPGSSGSA